VLTPRALTIAASDGSTSRLFRKMGWWRRK